MDKIKREENLIALENEKTELKKEQFIREIRNGLGEHIKNNDNKTIPMRKSWGKRILSIFSKIF